jgi:pyruvate dehydrogenase E1 component alpha subunit
MIKNLEQYPIVRASYHTKESLQHFETLIVSHWENAKIRGPVHLSDGNEAPLIEIFKRISNNDWVFSTWRSHYHALLAGIDAKWLENEILAGKSITVCNIKDAAFTVTKKRFYSSAIVGATLSIALGVALGLKRNKSNEKVWCFIGDMAFETGAFYEAHKYARNFDLPLHFVVEDNGISTYTPTESTWNKKREIPDDVIYYQYTSKYPHYGSGKWIAF